MRKLALNDEILLNIEKPARYIGNEVNSVMKDANEVSIRIVMAFPDVYEIGMSHLGIQILYDMFNQREDTWCERVYSPWPDLDKVMREKQIPLFALESQDPVKDFDFLGITIQYEMCYTNILQVLDLSQIPLRAADRTKDHPFVMGGGPCAYNPEPLAPFFDMFYIGEGETVFNDLLDIYKEWKKSGKSRKEFLEMAAEVPGIYVPAFYDVDYHEDGTIKAFTPNNPHAKEKIEKQVVMDVTHTYYPRKPVVPFIKATQDRVVLEIQRGCIRGCRFCQAGMLYRPTRERDLEFLKDTARALIESTGHEEISLSSLSSSDYSKLPELIDYLIEECSARKVMSKVQDIKKSSLTFAPEAGSQRLRDVINKGLTEEVILEGAARAFQGGWTRVKLYFMLGLPTETEEDMQGIAHLAEEIAKKYYEIPKDQRHGRCQIVVSTSFFVPKPFTPFQWAGMFRKEDYLDKAKVVKEEIRAQLNQKSIKYNYHEADVTVLEGILARGDRKVADVLETAYKKGAIFDSWSEYFRYDLWMEAFEELDIDPEFYTLRERPLDEIFPWDFISIGVTKNFLKREWEKAMKGEVTPNCRQQCSGCGAGAYKGGVCVEGKN